jgi:protein-tyrosine phosphatase
MLAADQGLGWTAFSRGLATERGIHNVGPISPNTVRGLAARNIPLEESPRYPLQLSETDLQQADVVIALKEEEHRPLVEERFPRWADKVVYWRVEDVGQAPVVESLAEIERQVRRLIDCLSTNGSEG